MDNLTKKQRPVCMTNIKSKNTEPELKIRKLLTSEEVKYRLHVNKLPGKPDIVVGRKKFALFINGCFWHQHKNCSYAVMPKSNLKYWESKLKSNVLNQKENIKQLKHLGWKSIIIWECQVNNNKLLSKIISRLKK